MFKEATSVERLLSRRVLAKQAAAITAGAVIVVALSVLAGWVFDIPLLIHWGFAVATTKPLTALGFLMAGSTVLMVVWPMSARRARLVRWCAITSATATVALGVVCLGLKALTLGYDNPAPAATTAAVLLLRPSWATSLALAVCGVGLLMLQVPRRWAVWGRWAAALMVGTIAGVAVMGFALDVAEFYSSAIYHTMAYPTASSLLLLSLAMSLAQPEYGVVAVVLRDDAGGSMARRILPVVALLPPLVCLGVQAAIDAGALGARLGLGVVAIIVASVGAVVVGVTARRLGEADAATRHSERRVRFLLAELDHRIKNNMAAVVSISEQTAARSETIGEFRKAYRGRLQAMARAHDALSSQRWQGASLRQLVDTVVGPYALADSQMLQVRGDDVMLPSAAAMSLAITLNELATNAIKHGAWSVVSSLGKVEISWTISAQGELALDWQETGGPPPGRPSKPSFGLELIRGMVPHDMGGKVTLLMDPPGLRCQIRSCLARAQERSASRYAAVNHAPPTPRVKTSIGVANAVGDA